MPDERRDDWRHSVDEHLVSLTSAQKVTDRELEDIEQVLSKLEKVVGGDAESELEGLVEQVHYLNREIAKLNAVVFVDSTGKKGLLKTVELLAEGREDRRVNWGNLTKILVAAIMSGLLGHLWPTIKASLNAGPVGLVDNQTIKKKGKKIVRIRRIAPSTSDSGDSQTPTDTAPESPE